MSKKPHMLVEADGRKAEWRDGELVLQDGQQTVSIPNCSSSDAAAIAGHFCRPGPQRLPEDFDWRPPSDYHERQDRENDELSRKWDEAHARPDWTFFTPKEGEALLQWVNEAPKP